MSAIAQRRVLVVDDEPLVQDSLKMIFAFEGYAVDTANSGKEALAYFEKGKYELIVTDYAMPVMRGDELAVAIKVLDPLQSVIMITAYAEMLMAQGPTVPGIDYVLSKPFLLEDFRLALKTVRGGGKQDLQRWNEAAS